MLELAIELCRVLPLVLVEKQPQEECLAFRSTATIKCLPRDSKKFIKLFELTLGPGGQ